MARTFLIAALCWGCVAAVAAHNIGVTPITWNREISRLIYDKCASCHRPGGIGVLDDDVSGCAAARHRDQGGGALNRPDAALGRDQRFR